jgi:uncharacterized protein (TIGR02118 family)
MLKFIVMLYKRPDMTEEEFLRYYRETHGPMAVRLPGIRRYAQNYVVKDPKRKHPGWSAVAELYFDDWESMEIAWAAPEGVAATNDLEAFADLTRTAWSVVEEVLVIE